jgi:N utilization substance protein B
VARYSERSLGRQYALQFLFSLEFMDTPWEHALGEFWNMQPDDLTEGGFEDDETPVTARTALKKADRDKARLYAEELIAGVCGSREELDARIAPLLANWTPERVGRIEWAIIRIALYELLYVSIPDTVVIAEAVQLANSFGDTESPRFVNGLLNQLANMDTTPDEQDTP